MTTAHIVSSSCVRWLRVGDNVPRPTKRFLCNLASLQQVHKVLMFLPSFCRR